MLNHEAQELFAFAGMPIFEHERRKLRLIIDAHSLTRFANIAWIAAGVVSLIVWLLAAVIGGGDTTLQDRLTALLVCVAIAVMLAMNFYSAFTITYGLHNQINSEQWTLIRTTGLRERTIFQAEYALARLRAWHLMVIEIAFRIALVEVILLDSLRFVIGPTSALGLFLSLPATLVLILCGLAIGIYFLEPFWRMKMVAALSLAIASRFRNTSVAYLTLFGVTSAVHCLQIGCLVLVSYFLVAPTVGSDEAIIAITCLVLPFGGILLFCSTYLLYKTLRNRSLKFALKRMFAPMDW